MDSRHVARDGIEVSGSSLERIQFRVTERGSDDRVSDGDDAPVVVTVPLAVVNEEGFDPTTEFMRGRLKATGHTGLLLDALSSGLALAELSRLASQP